MYLATQVCISLNITMSCFNSHLIFPHQVESLLAKHDWIARDRQYFGKANTAYDFSANEPREVEKKLAKLQEQKVPLHDQSYILKGYLDQ